ncbi:hypothetical protein [Litoribrevibacter albus]|uniref:Transmembrane protein n=1 Tax=Litoribrevibacter albus TaxID=1473156 RepID=A0AA37SDM1_9GAMM|nr:hypothetical protein [Litoribrevibacter albus]GLQ33080.1 hypothetical protein GCM10007876_35590 [Litoribrevibacter albus]
MNASYNHQMYRPVGRFPTRTVLWLSNLALLALLVIIQIITCDRASAETDHYMIDDDHLASTYQSSILPHSFTTLYETTLPNFFGQDTASDPKISISIQQLDDSRDSALMDDEKQQVIRPFSGDPLDRKALVIEVPFE